MGRSQRQDDGGPQVIRWQTTTLHRWSEEDSNTEASYIARSYYKIPCPDC